MAAFLFDFNNVTPIVNESVGRAGCGDFSLMAKRIREGVAVQRELDFAADYLEGKRTVDRRKKYKPEGVDDLEIYEFLNHLMVTGTKDYLAFESAKERFGIGPTRAREIYLIIREAMDAGRDPEWHAEVERLMEEDAERRRQEAADK